MRRENTGAAGWKRAGVFAGMAVLAAVLSGCGNGAEADFSLAEPAWTEEQTSPAEPARTEAQTSAAEDARTGGILEAAAGNWRLAGTKTEDHLKEFGDLQEMFGTGIHEGSQMTIGADGSFSFYLGIALGGEGTVREEDGILVADITPYEPEGRGGSPASFAVIPVTEDGSWYLTTETMGETMYWERLPGTDGAEPGQDGQEAEKAVIESGASLPASYGKILWDAYSQGLLPDGRPLDYRDEEETQKNSFAICDVDGDGKEELLLKWTAACVAGMGEFVYGCDGEECYLELNEFPEVRYYKNGSASADWSHNQGLAGRVWPQNYYRYDPERDVYESYGSMDAWDKGVMEEKFPDEIDEDGDGLIFYLMPAGWDGDYNKRAVKDGAFYAKWRKECLGDEEEIQPLYRALTRENIEALGFAEP